MGKRASSGSSVAVPKKPKNDPIMKKCKTVIDALKCAEDLSEQIGGLLGDVIPLALGVCKDERHEFQREVVQSVGEELARLEAKHKKQIVDVQARLDGFAAETDNHEKAVANATNTLKTKEVDLFELKKKLGAIAETFQDGKKTFSSKQLEDSESDAEFKAVVKKIAELDVIRTELLQPLVSGTREQPQARVMTGRLVQRLAKLMTLDVTLVTSLPSVFDKALSSRGNFDNMTIKKLEDDVTKHAHGFKATIDNGELTKSKCADAVKTADIALQKAKDKQVVCTKAFLAGRAEVEEATKALAEAKKSAKQAQKDNAMLLDEKDVEETQLEVFRGDVLSAYEELLNRTLPEAEKAQVVGDEEVPKAVDTVEVVA